MEKQEMGELLRLLHAARRSGVLGQIMDTMEVGEQPAGMSDATKRRKEDPEEFSSESEWDATVGQSSGSPAIDNQARYVTEGDTVVAKPMKKEKGGKTSAMPVKAPDTSHVRHVDKSFAVPPGPADFKVWSQTVVVMDKFADMNWSFSELLAAGEGDAKIARYISWIVGTYATPAAKDPQNQAEDFGLFARACGWKPKTKGYQRKTKWILVGLWEFLIGAVIRLGWLQSIALWFILIECWAALGFSHEGRISAWDFGDFPGVDFICVRYHQCMRFQFQVIFWGGFRICVRCHQCLWFQWQDFSLTTVAVEVLLQMYSYVYSLTSAISCWLQSLDTNPYLHSGERCGVFGLARVATSKGGVKV